MKRFFLQHFPTILFIVILLILFKTWFLPGVLTGGDMPYYFPELMKSVPFLSSWDIRSLGMGSSMLPTLWLQMYTTATLKVFSFLPWDMYVRIVWFFPYLLFGTLSMYFLSKKYMSSHVLSLFSSFLYVANTYALLLVGGGQMGIALSYSFAPFSLLALENLLNTLSLKNAVIFSVVYSVVIILDIRIAYLMAIIFFIRFLFSFQEICTKNFRHFVMLFIVIVFIILGLHAFWLLPTLLTRGKAIQQFGDIYTTTGAVQFFSFAKLENSMGLLHPNWPENIFGKVAFMRPEFLLLPLLAFISLFFVSRKTNTSEEKKEKKFVLFFTLLGVVGIFLAKGANDPFGSVYLWLFTHIPGFIMFRDPTKWYILIAFAYALLIPFGCRKIFQLLQKNTKRIKYTSIIFILLLIVLIAFLEKPLFTARVHGTFMTRTVPQGYMNLKNYLNNNTSFSRTLWVPVAQRFAFSSYQHPVVSGQDFYHTASLSGVLDNLTKLKADSLLRDSGIAYVVVPYDSEKEIFLSDRKYDDIIYKKTVQQVKAIPWLREISGFGNVRVFALTGAKDHFWLASQGTIQTKVVSPTEYVIRVSGVAKGEKLIFAETFDNFWYIKTDQIQGQKSIAYQNILNSFLLPKNGTYTVTISYLPQMWVSVGLWISVITSLLATIFFFRFK
ncbi:MAG TPA: hypothetical protein VLB73_03045 [Patescibacteria group bacterium]|nr:hypothetical protein [Patescibacteria group bacterium]